MFDQYFDDIKKPRVELEEEAWNKINDQPPLGAKSNRFVNMMCGINNNPNANEARMAIVESRSKSKETKNDSPRSL